MFFSPRLSIQPGINTQLLLTIPSSYTVLLNDVQIQLVERRRVDPTLGPVSRAREPFRFHQSPAPRILWHAKHVRHDAASRREFVEQFRRNLCISLGKEVRENHRGFLHGDIERRGVFYAHSFARAGCRIPSVCNRFTRTREQSINQLNQSFTGQTTRTSFDAHSRRRTRAGVNLHPDASRASFRRRRDAHASIVTPQVVHHIVRSDIGKVERAANHELGRGADRAEVFMFIIIGNGGVRHDGCAGSCRVVSFPLRSAVSFVRSRRLVFSCGSGKQQIDGL